MTGQEIIDTITEELNGESVMLIGAGDEAVKLAEAIVGLTSDSRAVYDRDKLVKIYVERDGMTVEEAEEWIDYNIIRSLPYYPDKAPVLMQSLP